MNKTARAHLAKLYARAKQLTPEAVINDAKNPKSPLHKYFEWDDRKAAYLYRLSQAREMIANYVEVETQAREFTYVRSRKAYVMVSDVVQDANLAQEMIDSFKREILNIVEAKRRILQFTTPEFRAEFEAFIADLQQRIAKLERAA